MKKVRFAETQIISILKQQEAGISIKDLAREHGVSEATIYNWKAKYGGMQVSEVGRIRELEKQNAELKKMYAEASMDVRALKNLIEKKL